MKAIVFIVCLCSFLINAGNNVYACMHQYKVHSTSATHIDKYQQDDIEYMVEDDNEDHHINHLLARKCLLLTKQYLFLSDPLISDYLKLAGNKQFTSGCNSTSLYITQRVLRI